MTGSPKRSALLSGLLHAGVIVLIVVTTAVKTPPAAAPVFVPLIAPRDISRYHPSTSKGGGGGGKHDELPARKGQLPHFSRRPYTPPAVVVRNLTPSLAMEPALLGDPRIIVPDFKLPYGDPNGVPGSPSDGRGKGGGIGDGNGPGIGNGKGPGAGGEDGDGGIGGGRAGIRGVITAPVVLYKIEPEYTDEARKARVQGTVMLSIQVGTDGLARNIEIRQSLGLGLDERAVEAVKKWKFKPGYRNGKPIVTTALVEVFFRLL
jgi:protein TonB